VWGASDGTAARTSPRSAAGPVACVAAACGARVPGSLFGLRSSTAVLSPQRGRHSSVQTKSGAFFGHPIGAFCRPLLGLKDKILREPSSTRSRGRQEDFRPFSGARKRLLHARRVNRNGAGQEKGGRRSPRNSQNAEHCPARSSIKVFDADVPNPKRQPHPTAEFFGIHPKKRQKGSCPNACQSDSQELRIPQPPQASRRTSNVVDREQVVTELESHAANLTSSTGQRASPGKYVLALPLDELVEALARRSV
jgi:hypothetical protein